MNAYFVIITEPLRVLWDQKKRWCCHQRSYIPLHANENANLVPSFALEASGKTSGNESASFLVPAQKAKRSHPGTIMLESFFPKIGIHRCLLGYLKLPHGGTRPNLAILFVVNCKTLPSQHLAKASLGEI